jgi:Fe-S-cluster containining protein
VIFANVKLQAEDNVPRLKLLGLAISTPQSGPPRLNQPCAALDGCRCRIYANRPRYCRDFECLLLKKVETQKLKTSTALEVIKTARERAEKVRHLLRDLGDADEHLPLSLRFRRTAKKMEHGRREQAKNKTFSQLTLAVHDLNLLLSKSFYPSP